MASVSKQRPSKIVSDAIDALDLGTASTLTQEEVVLESERNAVGGFAGISGTGTIEASVSIRQGTEVELDSLVPADGELLAELDSNGLPVSLSIGDGVSVLGNHIIGTVYRELETSFSLADGVVFEDVPGMDFEIRPNEFWMIFLFVQHRNVADGVQFKFSTSTGISTSSDSYTTRPPLGSIASNTWSYSWTHAAESGSRVYPMFTVFATAFSTASAYTMKLQACKQAALAGAQTLGQEFTKFIALRLR